MSSSPQSWTIKKAEWWIIDAFELWCWRRLLRVPWTEGRSNQSILKEINPEYSLEGLMLQLKFQYFFTCYEETTHWKRSWCCERLKAGGEEGNRGWDGCMALPFQSTWVWASSGRWWRSGKLGVLQSMGSQRVGHKLVTEQHHQPEALLNHITTTIHANVCSVTLHCSHILIVSRCPICYWRSIEN